MPTIQRGESIVPRIPVTGRQRIVDFLARHPGKEFTRGEISCFSGIPINIVTPRVLELIIAGELQEGERRKCRLSGRNAYPVRKI